MTRPSKQLATDTTDAVRLQKVLASRGMGSRRHCETLISDGRLYINGERATLGDKVVVGDQVKLDGKVLNWLWQDADQQVQVLAYHKPIGEMCTRNDPEGRPTVFDNLPKIYHQRWVSVGRLDINTAGLLLFTNSGDLANVLMHPSKEVAREYMVRVFGRPSADDLAKLQEGVMINTDQGKVKARFHSVHLQDKSTGGKASQSSLNQWYKVTLAAGRYREVRQLWEAIDCEVNRLIRIQFGPIRLNRQTLPGQFVELSNHDIRQLCRVGGLEITQ